MSTHENTTTIVTKLQTRQVRENEIIKSDRIDLVDQANRFVDHMVTKTTLPRIGMSFTAEIELSAVEIATYQSALQFLRRQFDQGYSHPETMQRRVESDDTKEYREANAAEPTKPVV